MGTARIETGTGTIDGVNTVFFVSTPYKVGSVQYFLNGQLKVKEFDDGCVEISSLDREIHVKEAPLPGDVVQFYFIDTTDATDTEVITVGAVSGGLSINEATNLIAQIPANTAAAEIRGLVAHSTVNGGVGAVTVSNAISGTIQTTTTLTATIKGDC